MPTRTVEERREALEVEVTRLKLDIPAGIAAKPWWEEIRGRFKDDAAYEEAMRYGREYRESLKPDDSQSELA
jgi:hypothetical protein